MHVVILIYSLDIGGAERQAVVDANALSGRGHRVTVVRSLPGDLDHALKPDVGQHLLGCPGMVRAGLRLRPRLKEWSRGEPLVVHSHLNWAHTVAAIAHVGAVRLVLNEHGLSPWRRASHRTVLRWCERKATAVVASCEEVRRLLVERDGLPARKTRVVYNSLDPGLVSAQENHAPMPADALFTIGFVGRFHPVKRLPLLVELATRLRSEGRKFRMELVGDGGERPAILAMIAARGLQGQVFCPGATLNPGPLLRGFDALVLPSSREGLSLTLMEASANGVPCVAFDVGGNKEIVRDRETGFLVENGDSGGIWRAVTFLMDHGPERAGIGRAAREFALRTFSLDRRVAALEEVYGLA